MEYIDFGTVRRQASGYAAPALIETLATAPDNAMPANDVGTARPLAHIVDVDGDARRLLGNWLASAGIESRTYSHLGAFLAAVCSDRPGCLVVDAQPPAIGGFGPLAAPARIPARYPVIMTSHHADVLTAVEAMKAGAVDFVEKPLRRPEIVAAVRAAIDLDRQQRDRASRHATLLARFETLSQRERQVMALVTTGKLNKQVGGCLGLSEITIKAHRGSVMRKMAAPSLADLVRMSDALGPQLAPLRNDCSERVRTAAGADRRRG